MISLYFQLCYEDIVCLLGNHAGGERSLHATFHDEMKHTIGIDDDWWNLEDPPVPSPLTAASEFNKIRPEDPSIPEVVIVAETTRIPRACIVPLVLAHSLLTVPYLSPAAAYTLLLERVAAWNWDVPLAPLMTWPRVSLYQACPGVNSLPPLELADHIIVRRQTLQRQLVPRTRERPATPAPTYIVQQAQPVARAAPAKKKTGGTLVLSSLFPLQAGQCPRPRRGN